MKIKKSKKSKVSCRKIVEAGCCAPPPVLVMGMHNSGTSILAEIMHTSGIFLENSMDHFESYFFSIFINDQAIMSGGENWAKVPIMDKNKVISYEKKLSKFIKKNWIVSYLMNGYDGRSKWGFKDPRLCVLIPLYEKIFPKSKVVYIERDTYDIAASLCQKGKKGVGKLDDFKHWVRLSRQYKDRAEEFVEEKENSHKLRYEKMCTNTKETMKDLFDFLNIEFTKEAQNISKNIHSRRINSFEEFKRMKKNSLYYYSKKIKDMLCD